MFPAGFYWYGAKRKSAGRTPAWLQRMLSVATVNDTAQQSTPSDADLCSDRGGDGSDSTELDPIMESQPCRGSSGEDQLTSNDQETEDHHDVSDFETVPSVHPEVAETLRDLSQLPLGVLDDTAPVTSKTMRYCLKDHSQQQWPRRLMKVTVWDKLT